MEHIVPLFFSSLCSYFKSHEPFKEEGCMVWFDVDETLIMNLYSDEHKGSIFPEEQRYLVGCDDATRKRLISNSQTVNIVFQYQSQIVSFDVLVLYPEKIKSIICRLLDSKINLGFITDASYSASFMEGLFESYNFPDSYLQQLNKSLSTNFINRFSYKKCSDKGQKIKQWEKSNRKSFAYQVLLDDNEYHLACVAKMNSPAEKGETQSQASSSSQAGTTEYHGFLVNWADPGQRHLKSLELLLKGEIVDPTTLPTAVSQPPPPQPKKFTYCSIQ